MLNGERLGSGVAITLDDVVARARRRGTECSDRARQHGLSYRRWRLWSSLLGIVAAIGSAVAATVLLLRDTGGGGRVVGGLFALVAAVCTIVNSGVMQTRVEEHRLARSGFLNLHTRYGLLGDAPPADLSTARFQLEAINRSHARIDVEAPRPDMGHGPVNRDPAHGPDEAGAAVARRASDPREPLVPSEGPVHAAPATSSRAASGRLGGQEAKESAHEEH